MVRHTTTDDVRFENDLQAFDAIVAGDVAEGDTVEVEYVDVNGERQTERGTVTNTEAVESGTTHGTEPRTWVNENAYYRVDYDADGKNDHQVASTVGNGDAPTLYTAVSGRHGDGGDRREMGTVVGITVEADGDDPDVYTDGGHPPEHDDTQQPRSSVDPTPTDCAWCGVNRPRESMRETHDGYRCLECYHDHDHEHADPDFDFKDVRHVSPDREPKHLTTADAENVALCGTLVGGLTTSGDPVDDVDDAVTLGAWVNVYDDMCPRCRDVFNDAVFDT